MTNRKRLNDLKKREELQTYFWNEVGGVEHISLPRLKDAITKEFNNKDSRFVQAQIDLMQTEGRIRIESNVKVWIRQPPKKAYSHSAA
jgi:hypothetical protein